MGKRETPGLRTPSSFVTFRLAKLQNGLNAQATAILKREAGLSLVEWRLIQVLRMFEDASLGEIAGHVQLDKGQLSRKTRAMAQRGLLRCERDRQDRRVMHLSLTAAALELSDRVMPAMERRQELLLSGIDPQDLKAFYRVIERLEATSKVREFQ